MEIETIRRIAGLPPFGRLMRLLLRSKFYCDYLRPEFLRFIPRGAVRTIFEMGACDGEDTLLLRDMFHASVYAFECNPEILPVCRNRLEGRRGIRLVEKAAWDSRGTIPFFPVVAVDGGGGITRNPGASSCLRAKAGYHESYRQKRSEVEAIRLDDFCRENGLQSVDLLCLDVQGVALHVLKGMGSLIYGTKFIIVELESREMYEGQDLFDETDGYLMNKGFEKRARVYRNDWFSDYLYVNRFFSRSTRPQPVLRWLVPLLGLYLGCVGGIGCRGTASETVEESDRLRSVVNPRRSRQGGAGRFPRAFRLRPFPSPPAHRGASGP